MLVTVVWPNWLELVPRPITTVDELTRISMGTQVVLPALLARRREDGKKWFLRDRILFAFRFAAASDGRYEGSGQGVAGA